MRWKLVAATAVAALALAGCVSDTQPPPNFGGGTPPAGAGGGAQASPTGSPLSVNTAEALKVVNKEFDLLKKQDWAGAWALWSKPAQREVAKKEFVTANRTCPVSPGAGFQLMEVKPLSQTLIELNWRRDNGVVGRGSLVLAGGRWYFQPDAQTLSEYSSGAAKAISNRRENGTCGK